MLEYYELIGIVATYVTTVLGILYCGGISGSFFILSDDGLTICFVALDLIYCYWFL